MPGVGGQLGWRRAFKDGGSEEDDKIQSSDAIQALVEKVRVAKPFPMAPVTIMRAEGAYKIVLDGAGATLPKRDPVDERSSMNRTGP